MIDIYAYYCIALVSQIHHNSLSYPNIYICMYNMSVSIIHLWYKIEISSTTEEHLEIWMRLQLVYMYNNLF